MIYDFFMFYHNEHRNTYICDEISTKKWDKYNLMMIYRYTYIQQFGNTAWRIMKQCLFRLGNLNKHSQLNT